VKTVSGAGCGRREFWRRHLFIIPIACLFFTLFLILFFDNTTMVWPDHSVAIAKSGFATGIVLALVLGGAGFIVKPQSRYSWPVTMVGLAFCGLIAGTLTGMAMADHLFQLIDFSGPNVVRSTENFPIVRAYKTHGKGACDRVQIPGEDVSFCINRREYKEKFLDAEDVRTRGYCLRADTERNGEAVRILHSSSRAFRRGAVMACSPADPPQVWNPR